MEPYKTSLLHEHKKKEIRFTEYHEKVLESLEALNSRYAQMIKKAETYVTGGQYLPKGVARQPTNQGEYERVCQLRFLDQIKRISRFQLYLEMRAIYLPDDILEDLRKAAHEMRDLVDLYKYGVTNSKDSQRSGISILRRYTNG